MNNIIKCICLALYYGFARYLPGSYFKPAKKIRYFICKGIFSKIGYNVNIEKNVYFGRGINIQIGDNSGLGQNCCVTDAIIGNNVMMGTNFTYIKRNHNFDRTDIPMIKQGYKEKKKLIVEDDVWIGSNVIILPGVTVHRGAVIGAGSVVTKNVPEYAIVGGNPAKLIRYRK